MPGQLFLAYNVNMFAKQRMNRSTRTPTLSQVRAVCTQREPTGRVIIVIVTESEEKREERRERERERRKEENDGRERVKKEGRKREGTREREGERERGMERETQREKRTPSSLLSTCEFKTSPCVRSKRHRVCRQHARMLFHTHLAY